MLLAVSKDAPVVDSKKKDRNKLYAFPGYIDWSNKSILIFERDYCSTLLLKDLLESTNIRVIHVDKKAIMENFYDESIDLIIKGIDVDEIMTGLELTRKIRLRYPHIPIIAHSACCINMDDIHHCLDAGCDDFIAKPFEFDDLISSLMKYLM